MAAGQFDGGDDYPTSSLGQPDSMRNEEQRLRDNQGGSELTNRPDDHPVGAPGETASAEAEGPPPDREQEVDSAGDERPREGQRIEPGDNASIGAPVRSAGPVETTLPQASALQGDRERGD